MTQTELESKLMEVSQRRQANQSAFLISLKTFANIDAKLEDDERLLNLKVMKERAEGIEKLIPQRVGE